MNYKCVPLIVIPGQDNLVPYLDRMKFEIEHLPFQTFSDGVARTYRPTVIDKYIS